MRSRLWAGLLGFSLLTASVGCAPVMVGLAVGAVGGYVVSPDTVEGMANRSLGEAWDAAKEIVSIMGALQDENERAGSLVALINGSRVQVTLTSINASSTKVTVKARKSFMPKVDLAQDVYAKIVNAMSR